MTKDEALKVLKYIARVHLVEVDGALAETWWNSALEHVSFDEGMKVARELAGSKDRMPKPAHFNEVLGSMRRHPSNQAEIAPVPGVITHAVGKAALAEMKAGLRGSTA